MRYALVPRALLEMEPAMQNRDIGVGRDDVHVIGLNDRTIDGFAERHGGRFGQRFAKKAGCVGSKCWISTKAIPVSGGEMSPAGG